MLRYETLWWGLVLGEKSKGGEFCLCLPASIAYLLCKQGGDSKEPGRGLAQLFWTKAAWCCDTETPLCFAFGTDFFSGREGERFITQLGNITNAGRNFAEKREEVCREEERRRKRRKVVGSLVLSELEDFLANIWGEEEEEKKGRTVGSLMVSELGCFLVDFMTQLRTVISARRGGGGVLTSNQHPDKQRLSPALVSGQLPSSTQDADPGTTKSSKPSNSKNSLVKEAPKLLLALTGQTNFDINGEETFVALVTVPSWVMKLLLLPSLSPSHPPVHKPHSLLELMMFPSWDPTDFLLLSLKPLCLLALMVLPKMGNETSARKPPNSKSTKDPTVFPFLTPSPFPTLCKPHSLPALMMPPSWFMKRWQENHPAQRAPRTPQSSSNPKDPPALFFLFPLLRLPKTHSLLALKKLPSWLREHQGPHSSSSPSLQAPLPSSTDDATQLGHETPIKLRDPQGPHSSSSLTKDSHSSSSFLALMMFPKHQGPHSPFLLLLPPPPYKPPSHLALIRFPSRVKKHLQAKPPKELLEEKRNEGLKGGKEGGGKERREREKEVNGKRKKKNERKK
ncbi:Pollen-specific leucine-rich repeat extensin-like protein 1, partial [Ophiophagus hannah]